MNLKYMAEMDTLYIYMDSETPKILVPSDLSDYVGVFVDKATRKKVCGYEIESASTHFVETLVKLKLPLKELLAIVVYFQRMTVGRSQEFMANEIDVSLSTYKNVEKAEQNLSIDTLETINNKFPIVKQTLGKVLAS